MSDLKPIKFRRRHRRLRCRRRCHRHHRHHHHPHRHRHRLSLLIFYCVKNLTPAYDGKCMPSAIVFVPAITTSIL